jgi:hypothetical protein
MNLRTCSKDDIVWCGIFLTGTPLRSSDVQVLLYTMKIMTMKDLTAAAQVQNTQSQSLLLAMKDLTAASLIQNVQSQILAQTTKGLTPAAETQTAESQRMLQEIMDLTTATQIQCVQWAYTEVTSHNAISHHIWSHHTDGTVARESLIYVEPLAICREFTKKKNMCVG